ncbi:MAG: stage II sporulation protein M [Gemmatimonadales bacterium]
MTPSARGPAPLDLRQHHGVETPEHVDVRFELAGVGSRTAAALLDSLLLFLILLLLGLVIGTVLGSDGLSGTAEGWVAALMILLFFGLLWGYFAGFEALNGGRTPGKQAIGIRVVMDTGRPVTPGAAVVRNLVRLLDCYFPVLPIVPAMLMMFLHRSNKRLGDLAAGTIVVRDRPTDWVFGAATAEPAREEPVETGPPELSEDEFRLLDRFLGRLSDLDPAVQVRITTELARRFEARIPRRTGDAQAYLVKVFADEQQKRRSRFATRARGPGAVGAAAGGSRTTVTAERFLAKKRDAWETFRALAVRMERSGIGALAAGEIPAFAARYREVAADLARARTYGVDQRVIEYLERVVSAGHNALYRTRGKAGTPIARHLLRDFPAAVVQSWAYVLLAFLMFMVPAATGYVMIRERPALADEVVSPVMVSRAEQAAARQAEGRGYAEAEGEERPVIAAAIISNNIQVSFLAFVGGLTAGLLTAWVLVGNGLLLGLGFGLFQNYGALDYLTTFVAGHGVLELTAIFIAAGAGFRLAKAIIAPGDRLRKDALVVEGAIAAKMVGAVVTLLAIAGTIEGLLSASDAPAAWKYGVSATTAVFLVLYLLSGWGYLKGPGHPTATTR